jgi:uncharacterized sulfatase
MPADRPNILFAFADDWGRYAGTYARHEGEMSVNQLLDTPNIDRVADDGVTFTNAFVPAPSCTPCRSSLLSGRYFWQCGLGAILLGARWDESIPSWPLLLEEAGYHVGYTYKVWSPGRTVNAPIGGKRTQYHQAGVDFNQFSFRATEWAGRMGVDAAKGRLLDEVRGNFDAFLAARPAGLPFCYWWGPTNTHRRWQQGSGKALWGLEPDDLAGRMPAFLPDVPEVREDVCDYLGECLAVDAGLGVLLGRLEEIGELDNTLVVVSGDHGIPGMPRAKCNLYDIGCEVALLARWPGRVAPGRVVDDLVNIMDLAPTFLEAAGVEGPPVAARSLMPQLTSPDSGRIDPSRDVVVTGRERHVDGAREGFLPYPQRALRTPDWLYVRNFAPDRWPMGDPKGLDDPDAPAPDYEQLAAETRLAYADLDAGPTKAWMIHHRAEEAVAPLFELGFGKRPGEELYDLRADPHYMVNLADDPACGETLAQLRTRLETHLREHDDPRLTETPCRFEHAPYAGPIEHDEPSV